MKGSTGHLSHPITRGTESNFSTALPGLGRCSGGNRKAAVLPPGFRVQWRVSNRMKCGLKVTLKVTQGDQVRRNCAVSICFNLFQLWQTIFMCKWQVLRSLQKFTFNHVVRSSKLMSSGFLFSKTKCNFGKLASLSTGNSAQISSGLRRFSAFLESFCWCTSARFSAIPPTRRHPWHLRCDNEGPRCRINTCHICKRR